MREKYIISIDQSTSSTKAILFDTKGQLTDEVSCAHEQYYPHSGWVEHDPEEIYENTIKAVNSLIDKNQKTKSRIEGIALTNQRETAVVWNQRTGKPVYNAVVWQCQRGKDICNKFREEGHEDMIKDKTGLLLDPYFSASKIKWILDETKNARQQAENGQLLLGTIDSWLIWKLTAENNHFTDYSNASRTLLFNIQELKWDNDLLNLFDIPESMVPEVKYSDEIFGYTDFEGAFSEKLPISGLLGDSHASLFGQNCYYKGEAKSTYGTGSSIMMNIGNNYQKSEKGLVTSLAWGRDNKVKYVFEGNVHSSAATIKWLVDRVNLLDSPGEAADIASSLEDNQGVYLVPAFVGLGAPYWDNEARAIICGMNFDSGREHIVRAAQESIAYQIKDVLDLMIAELGVELKELRADGGASKDEFLMQFQADMLGTAVKTTAVKEVSALGAAYMAGLALDVWENIEEIESIREVDKNYNPQMSEDKREKNYKGWKQAVKKAVND